jgi:hypothetical protein
MRIFLAASIVMALAQPAFAQSQQPIQKYGEEDKEKSPTQLQAERDAQKAYGNSLKNIPDKGPVDPWGAVRSNDAPKTAAKQKKTGTPQ